MQTLYRSLEHNWKAGLNVALISLPLSLSLAIASKATPIMGIITAIWAGIAAAIFGGSRYNVVGPAGALSGILAAFSMKFGMEYLPFLAILTGVTTLIFFALQWDKYIVFIPSAVIHGFTLGVAFIIGGGQINFALGLQNLEKHESFILNFMESVRHISSADPVTTTVFLLGLALLFVLLRLMPKVPGPVILALIGIGLGYASETHQIGWTLQTLVGTFGNFSAKLFSPPAFSIPPITMEFGTTLFTVTIVAILETILSAKIADTMAKTRQPFHQRKEVFGLGIANILSGIAGGLPATGVLARTALNVKSGATSSVASGLNTVFVAVLALLFFRTFQYLPLAIVASILVYVSIRMITIEHYADLFSFDKKMFVLSLIVGVLTVVIDPLVAILTGSTLSLMFFLKNASKGQSEITIHRHGHSRKRVPLSNLHAHDDHGDVTVYRLAGELTYFNAEAHRSAIRSLKKVQTVILSLRNLFYIDLDGLLTLEEIARECAELNRTLLISGAGSDVTPLLKKSAWFTEEIRAGHVFESTTDALTSLGFSLKG